MSLSPAEFCKVFIDRLLELHWRQWSVLGVSSHVESEAAWQIDLESLLVTTLALEELDSRLVSVTKEWLDSHRGFVNTARLNRIQSHLGRLETNPMPTRGSATPGKRIAPPTLTHPALGQLRLRALFGINARADLLLWMLAKKEGTASRIARETFFDQAGVYRILEDWVQAGVATVHREGREKRYRLVRLEEAASFLHLDEIPPWLNWPLVMKPLATIARSLDKRQQSDYLIASLIVDVFDELAAAGRAVGVTVPDPLQFMGEEYLTTPGPTAVLEVLGKL